MYTAMVRSNLEYYICVRKHFLRLVLGFLERVQRRATEMIKGCLKSHSNVNAYTLENIYNKWRYNRDLFTNKVQNDKFFHRAGNWHDLTWDFTVS